jgi:hypothetical protein
MTAQSADTALLTCLASFRVFSRFLLTHYFFWACIFMACGTESTLVL